MKQKKILFAAVDIGYRIELYTKFIEEELSDKLKAESLAIYVLPGTHYKTSYTYQYNYHTKTKFFRWYRSTLNFILFLFKYDIFHFISGETLLTRKLRTFEMLAYRLFNKRVIMQFVGADIRSYKYLEWKDKNIISYLAGEDQKDKTLPWQKKLISDSLKYADKILVSTPDLLEIIPSAVYYPVVIDVKKFMHELTENRPNEVNNKEITILHCPSNKQLKGTSYIHESLDRIIKKSRYPIKLILPTQKKQADGTPYAIDRYELFKLFQVADIIIDQLIIGWYGLQSIEGLLAGKEVICYVDEKLKSYIYPQCPIHLADAANIDRIISECIENVMRNGKPTYKQEQIKWVEKYHTIGNNRQALLDAWGITRQ
jgi:hypothetical protein